MNNLLKSTKKKIKLDSKKQINSNISIDNTSDLIINEKNIEITKDNEITKDIEYTQDIENTKDIEYTQNIEDIENTEDIEDFNNEVVNKTQTSYNKKLEIVKKINKIKKKEYLLNIFKIITTYSNEYTENTNGIFIFFHNLPDEVYEKIENYLNIIYKLHIKTDIKNIFDSDFSDTNVTETIYSNIDNQNKDLTNKEKIILRRKKYEEYLQQNQSL
jgi:hypothetical protein